MHHCTLISGHVIGLTIKSVWELSGHYCHSMAAFSTFHHLFHAMQCLRTLRTKSPWIMEMFSVWELESVDGWSERHKWGSVKINYRFLRRGKRVNGPCTNLDFRLINLSHLEFSHTVRVAIDQLWLILKLLFCIETNQCREMNLRWYGKTLKKTLSNFDVCR